MLDRILQWDREAFIYLNGLGIEQFDAFWAAVTDISTWIPLFLLFFLLILRLFPIRQGLVMGATTVLLVLFILWFTEFTKEFVARLRPNNDAEINTLIRILRSPTNYSFFSGHASSSFSVTTLMVLFLRNRLRWAYLFYLWPLLFALSRIYVGVHYPVDILVGAIVGLLTGWGFYRLYLLIAPYTPSGRPV
ncbi:phosphatase PAP2 family protein [Robiginitalea sp. SC105]|uniref:phosphatase PAP2 family protein n=1 Tax=Robiginitalea sp. SC105 TaxID=2762332 RepID=UPI00163ACBE7|nr:phosphatase PAP2 family protein [Robiginitalea sp. SC105]MBC2839057.1 phosphatase PAP2 family protein [Robiginitalea sp. SC105]